MLREKAIIEKAEIEAATATALVGHDTVVTNTQTTPGETDNPAENAPP